MVLQSVMDSDPNLTCKYVHRCTASVEICCSRLLLVLTCRGPLPPLYFILRPVCSSTFIVYTLWISLGMLT